MGTNFRKIMKQKDHQKFLSNFPCLILGQDTNPFASAKNLGVVFDSSLNFLKHISQTCRACFHHIVICVEIENKRPRGLDACQQHCKISATDVSENVYLCSKRNYHEKEICIGLYTRYYVFPIHHIHIICSIPIIC